MDHRWTDLGHSNNNSNNSSSYKSNHQHHILLISPSSRLCTLCVQVVAVAVVVVPTHTKVSMSERARCPSLSYVRQLTLCVRWRTQIHHSNRIQVAEQRRLSSTDCKETYVLACVCLIADTHALLTLCSHSFTLQRARHPTPYLRPNHSNSHNRTRTTNNNTLLMLR